MSDSLDLLDLIEEHEEKVSWSKKRKDTLEYQSSLKPAVGIVAMNEKGKAGLILRGNTKKGFEGIFLTGKIKEGWTSKNPKCLFDIQHIINQHDLY